MDFAQRIKKFFVRLLVLVRKKMRAIEAKLDEMRPHPILGGFGIIVGAVVLVAGVAMMVLPGPGVLGMALGIAIIAVSIKIVQGAYGPDRVKREKAAKRERLRRKRKQREEEQDTPQQDAVQEDTAQENADT